MMKIRVVSVFLVVLLIVSLFSNADVGKTASRIEGSGPNKGFLFDPDKDDDNDGLTNAEEDKLGLFIFEADTDGDSFEDGEEGQKYGTDPKKADTDGDGLSDSVEILDFKTDPFNKDENENGVLDGEEERTVDIPSNEFGIVGTVTGTGPITRQFSIEKNPIIMLDHAKTIKMAHIQSLNKSLQFKFEIPFDSTVAKDPSLYVYRYQSGELDKVVTQRKKGGNIEAKMIGGGVIVIASISEVEKSKIPAKLPSQELTKNRPSGKVHVANIPGLTINAADLFAPNFIEDGQEVDRTGIISFQSKNNKNIEEIMVEATEADTQLKATYEVDSYYTDGETHYAKLRSVSTESGKTPTIMVHGLWGGADTWGYENYWNNDGSRPYTEKSTSCTFSGKSYSSGYYSYYSNYDVHYLCSRTDNAELGSQLDIDFAYTPNVDLFGFEYHHDGHVDTGAYYLGYFINRLRETGKIGSTQDVNLMAHSKGGLVSRYSVENYNRSGDVDRILTFGTPHFGSDAATTGDMDRDDSDLWINHDTDSVCERFTNYHPYTQYFAVGGFDPYSTDINNTLRGYHSVGKLSTSYDYDVRYRFKTQGIGLSGYSDIEDGSFTVNIDSALGSDDDPDYAGTMTTLAKLTINDRFYIFHETYGDHSKMRKHPDSDNYAAGILAGNFD
jgi:hypothetical protein